MSDILKSTKNPEDLERRARLATIRSRVSGLSHLQIIDGDPNKHYEFEVNEPMAIMKKQMLGFEVETAPVTFPAQHGSGDGKNIVGDCILMSTSQQNYGDLQYLEHEEYVKRHGSPDKDGNISVQAEEVELNKNLDSIPGIVNLIEESNTSSIGKDEILAANAENSS